MYKNIKVEAENLELIIENSHGDKAIIPANKRDWVKQKLSEGCHSCIDSLVETLPIASQYAQDGSVYPSVRTTKFDDTTENKYQQWRASLPKNLQYEGDYDLRGFYKENPDFNINDSEQHLTDKWKLPNHPTFSDESVYYKGNENYGGKWKSYDYGDVYTPNNPEVKQQKLEWKKGFYSKDKVVVDGKLYDINTPEYKEIYDKGIGYFDKTGTFISSKEDLPEVTVSSKIQPNTVSSYISEFAKQTPKEEYLQNKSREHNKKFYSAPLWAQQVVGGYNEERKKSDRKRDEEDYNKLQSNFITEKLLNRNKQKDNETRVQWLQRFSDKELEVIKNSDYKSKIEPSIWSKFEQGLLSIGNAGSPVTFKNENLTKEEAKQEDNPLNILQPLSIPTKMVQSAYKDNYSFTDALKGKQNNAGIVEDIVTDPLNLVGLGIWSKLSKANKFKNLDEAYNAIKTLDKASLEKKLGNTISNEDWQYLYRVQEKGFDIEKPTLKAIEDRVAAGEGKWYDKNILNNPELRSNIESRDKYYGQWFEKDPKRLDYYLADKGEDVEILRTKVPKKILEQYRIDKFDPEIAKKWSLSHETEYVVPKDLIQQAEKFDKKDWQKLIDEHEKVKQLSKEEKLNWQLEELPGLHLKSTMTDGAISKIIEPKTGLINVEQALGIIGKESGGVDKVSLIRKGLGENIPKKMDYNEFRKVVQDQLIPLEKQFTTHSSGYGIDRLGYYNTDDVSMVKIWEIAGYTRPLENQTLILSNKGKFGRGSSAHGNPDETLGHIHFLRDAETPDVLTVTQIQSDAFQGTHRIMPKTQQEALEKVSKLKKEGIEIKSIFGDGKESSNAVLANYEKHLQLDEASTKNFTQKQLLDKNHPERYLQELVDYAGKRGDINKVRVPTSETAAKVQGYKKITLTGDNTPGFADLQEKISIAVRQGNQKEVDELMKIHDKILETPYMKYSDEHQTILKKYKDNPKLIKKLFGEEPKIVTDSKGNTWYEFDIPKKFKKGKGEIKAFTVVPAAIGTSAAIQSQNQNKSEQ